MDTPSASFLGEPADAGPVAVPMLQPIGHIETPFASRSGCPRNGRQLRPAPACRAVVAPEFQAGLAGLEGFSHLILLYWLHLERPTGSAALAVTPPFDGRLRGVFATRSPVRPNPIGFSVVAFDGFAGPGVLRVRHLDCVDGTPLLDVKPYLPTTDAEPEASMGWLGRHATLREWPRAAEVSAAGVTPLRAPPRRAAAAGPAVA